ncbi:MAG: MBL fold metallo-hydrolase [Cereibacter changlensis]|uniref:MBL fold metallo-hydrolase n=1 Tax=Cereibacter changlensis TaxID=402884 RepID=UPI00306344B9
MSALLRCTILGCGSSGGVPRLGGHWGDCDPAEPKNRRRRCSLLIERITDAGTTRVLIDTTPDLHPQLLDAGIGELDAVAWTHAHADHVHGIDDLRQIVFNMQKRLPVWADPVTQDSLVTRFGYAFAQPAGSLYPPILDLNTIDGPFEVEGAGGAIRLIPFRVSHGPTEALGFRVAGLAYLPDVVEIPPESWPVLEGLDMWVVDALRRKPHPTHAHLALTLSWIDRVKPARAIITNMHLDLDYATLTEELPEGVVPAFDGLSFDLDG